MKPIDPQRWQTWLWCQKGAAISTLICQSLGTDHGFEITPEMYWAFSYIVPVSPPDH